MDNQLIPIDTQLSSLSNYLVDTSESMTRIDLSVLPNYLKTLSDFVVENRRINLEKKKSIHKHKIAQQLISANEKVKLTEMDSYEKVQLSDIKSQTNVKLAEIMKDTNISLKNIKSHERIEIEKLTLQSETVMSIFDKQLDEQKRQFNEKMKRFDKIINYTKEVQKEMKLVFDDIHSRIMTGKATEEEHLHYETILNLRFLHFGQNIMNDSTIILSLLDKTKDGDN